MKVYRTAGLTAVWRSMGKVEKYSTEKVSFPMKVIGHVLGLLDPNSVETIVQRTRFIDAFIRKIKPKSIVEIGSGYSSRPKRFSNIKFHELDLSYFSGKNKDIIPFQIGKDKLDLDVEEALFIVEGVTMYLQRKQVIDLLRQIKGYKGHLLIDFFNFDNGSKNKNIKEKLYRFIFKLVIGRDHLFDYRIKDVSYGTSLLRSLGYKMVNHCPYKTLKTLDALFYAKL